MDFDLPPPGDLLAMLIFSIVGLIAFRSGKREFQPARLCIGMALMVYPYFIPRGFWLWATGIALSGSLYFFRD